MTTRSLPSVAELTEQQQRGNSCVWCSTPLRVGQDVDLGEQRARPTTGAAYSWFPRCCADTNACATREAGQAGGEAELERQLPDAAELTWAQHQGFACVWCQRRLTTGAVSAGVARGRIGAHVLDIEVYEGPCCRRPPKPSVV